MLFSGRTNGVLKYSRKWKYILDTPAIHGRICVSSSWDNGFSNQSFVLVWIFIQNQQSQCYQSSSDCLGQKYSTVSEINALLTLLMCLTCCLLLLLFQTGMCHSRPGGSNRRNAFGWSERQFSAPQWVWIHHQSARWKVRLSHMVFYWFRFA